MPVRLSNLLLCTWVPKLDTLNTGGMGGGGFVDRLGRLTMEPIMTLLRPLYADVPDGEQKMQAYLVQSL